MPIIHKGKYYLQVFNLKGGRCFIIDHVKRKGALEEIYGSVPRKMVSFFFIYINIYIYMSFIYIILTKNTPFAAKVFL